MTSDTQKILDRILRALASGDDEAMGPVLADVRAADIAEVLDVLDDEQRSKLLYALPPRTTAEVVVMLDEAVRGEVVDDLDQSTLTEIVTEMPPDDAADVVGDLTTKQIDEVLETIPQEQSDAITDLLNYDESSAGGIMDPRVLALPATATVAEAVEAVRKFAADEEPHFVYIIDEAGKLVGTVSLRKLVTNGSDVRLDSICDRDLITVDVDEDQEEVVHVFRKYDLVAIPVVDAKGRLLGRVTSDDVMDVAEEEVAEDILRMAGTDPAELETHSTFRAARVRMFWLVPCMLGTLLSGGALMLFHESRLSTMQMAALIWFVPMVAATGGNAGIQTSVIVLRGLATGELVTSRLKWVFEREARIAVVVSVLCAVVSGTIGYVFLEVTRAWGVEASSSPDVDPVRMGIAIGLGMMCGIIEAAGFGMIFPFVFRKFGVDPAIASGPLVTMVNDVLSISFYLLIALAILT
jgi:magnesium transporter